MPRLRTLALALFVSLVSFGLGAGLAYRWLLRELLLAKTGRAPTLAEILRPRGTELRALGWGIAFLPVFWGGVLTFCSPMLAESSPKGPAAALVPWLVAGLLILLLRLLYVRAWPMAGEVEAPPGEGEPSPALDAAGREAFRRQVRVTLWCGLPGLALCSLTLLADPLTPFAALAIFAIPPALVAPLVGAVSSLPILARAGVPPTRSPVPARRLPAPLRWATVVAGLGLLGFWGTQAHRLVAPPRFAPLLEVTDFASSEWCAGWGIPFNAPGSSDDVIRARLAQAGAHCDRDSEAGVSEVVLGDQTLDFCRPYDDNKATRVTAIGSDGTVHGPLEVQLVGYEQFATRAGVTVLVREQDGLRVVRIGRGARIDASYRPPDAGGANASWLAFQRAPGGGVMVAWPRDAGAALVHLTDDLVPLGPPRLVGGNLRPSSLRVGRGTCLYLDGPGSDWNARVLVLDDRDRPHRPSVGERVEARAAAAFHLTWTGIVLAIAGIAAMGAGRMRRRIARATATGTTTEGALWATGANTANLRRADGEVVHLRTAGARWHGFADGEPHDGPCTVVGTPPNAGGAPYRSAPSEIDAATTSGIVRGDLAQARAWAAGHRDRVWATAVLIGWLTTGATLLLLALPS